VSVLNALNLEGKVLFVLDKHNPNIYLSLRNIPQVNSCTWDMLNVYQVLWHDKLVITERAAEKLEAKFVGSEGQSYEG
jgi:large subunit ribosomal protein L4